MTAANDENVQGAESDDAFFLDRYAKLIDGEKLKALVGDLQVRARIAEVMSFSEIDLSPQNADFDWADLAGRLRKRPDLVHTIFRGRTSVRVEGKGSVARLGEALANVADDSTSDGHVEALKDTVARMASRFGDLSGEPISLDVAKLASHGRPALVHLLHTSPSVPSFGAAFAKRGRVSAAQPSARAAAKASSAPDASSRPEHTPVTSGGATSGGTTLSGSTLSGSTSGGSTSGGSSAATDAEKRRAEIEALLDCCPPPGKASGERITFPTALPEREDIYYDFSILVPVEGGEEPLNPDLNAGVLNTLQSSSTSGFRALVSFATSIIATLDAAKMRSIYGPVLIKEIEDHLANATAHIQNPQSWFREGLRRTSRELASVLRLIARTRLHAAPGQSDALKQAQALVVELEKAVTGFRFSLDPKGAMPKRMGTAAYGDSTVWPAPIPEHDKEGGAVLWANGVTQLPDADWMPFGPTGNSSLQRWFNWIYNWDHIPDLRGYLDGMAGTYPDIVRLKDLCSQAASLLTTIDNQFASGAVGDAEYRQKIEQLLGGLANDAAYALATILDELAELIAVPFSRRAPYSKRLAVQIVYRQTWSPTGYSRGKMVGYKTLLPGETQQVKRKTFVKTTSESTTTEDFAASRANDFSSTQRETSDVLKETGDKFDFRASASGHVDFAVAGAEVKAETGVALAGTSKNVRNSITEAVTKGSVAYSNKREVKVRELVEREVTDESVTNLANSNQEITANYFYYQLFRNYDVSTILYDARPVILVARDYPTPAQVDEVWLGKHMHDLLFALPAQLAADAAPTINSLEAQSRRMIRARSAAARAQAEYELLRDTMLPNLANAGASPVSLDDRQRDALAKAAATAAAARDAFAATETEFLDANTKLSRVVAHVRENILMCMHRIWQAGSDADRQRALREETFFGIPLDRQTRGLNRLGFLGEEEVYEFTGKSALVLDLLLELMISGTQTMALPDGTPLKEQLIRRVVTEQGCTRQQAIDYIKASFVVSDEDPSGAMDVPRTVQVAQDAVAVDAMPGTTPLLEGFKLAHRALDVQRACLENQHLAARIVDRPWANPKSVDDYTVARSDAPTGPTPTP